MEKFLEMMAEIMEVDVAGLTLDTDFRKVCEFNSLMGLYMMTEIENNYGVSMSVKDFLLCNTLGDLYKLAAKE